MPSPKLTSNQEEETKGESSFMLLQVNSKTFRARPFQFWFDWNHQIFPSILCGMPNSTRLEGWVGKILISLIAWNLHTLIHRQCYFVLRLLLLNKRLINYGMPFVYAIYAVFWKVWITLMEDHKKFEKNMMSHDIAISFSTLFTYKLNAFKSKGN